VDARLFEGEKSQALIHIVGAVCDDRDVKVHLGTLVGADCQQPSGIGTVC
jgi:hypothetical protein